MTQQGSDNPRFNQGLGWYVLRTPQDVATLSQFYQRAFDFPELRAWDGGSMLWVGGYSVFEIGTGGAEVVVKGRDIRAPACWPVFATPNTTEIHERILALGGEWLGGGGRQYFLDPQGFPFALEPAAPAKGRQIRLSGELNWPADRTTLAGIALRVADVAAEKGFFGDVLSLRPLAIGNARPQLDLGDGTYLELREGGCTETAPADRKAVTGVFILRVYGYAALTATFSAREIQRVNELHFAGGDLSYYLDPENHLFGFQERKPFDPAEPMTHFPEDVAARAAWEREP